MELKGHSQFAFDYVCRTYEKLIQKFRIINQRVLIWIRYKDSFILKLLEVNFKIYLANDIAAFLKVF